MDELFELIKSFEQTLEGKDYLIFLRNRTDERVPLGIGMDSKNNEQLAADIAKAITEHIELRAFFNTIMYFVHLKDQNDANISSNN